MALKSIDTNKLLKIKLPCEDILVMQIQSASNSLLNQKPRSNLNKLNVSHWGIVPSPWQGSNDPGISSISVPVPILNLSKQGMNNLLLIYKPKCLSSFVECTLLRQSDHFVNVLPDSTCTCFCSPNAPMLKELSCEASKKGTTLVWGPVEFRNPPPMPHSKDLKPERTVMSGFLYERRNCH
uniref:Uncharacterized protein n=1 Tax=Opuntia streptacantha TaxID=393608 RepID=A0A7C8ZAT7_OPUST